MYLYYNEEEKPTAMRELSFHKVLFHCLMIVIVNMAKFYNNLFSLQSVKCSISQEQFPFINCEW